MTYRKGLKAGAALAVLVTSLAVGGDPAQAGALFLDPAGSSSFILDGQTDDIVESIHKASVFSRDAYYGSTIRLNSKMAGAFTFRGFETRYDNKFPLDAHGNGRFDLIFSNRAGGPADVNGKARSAAGDTYTGVPDPAAFTAGIIPFMLKADLKDTKEFVANGGSPGKGKDTVNFFTPFHPSPTATSGSGLVPFLDGGGAGPNNDHDDVGVRVAVVPEPATMAVLGVGLLALGWVGARKKKNVPSLKTE